MYKKKLLTSAFEAISSESILTDALSTLASCIYVAP